MIIILTIQESDNQIISGFPEYVVFSTNVPSTIFYTINGSEPNEDSEIFVDRLYLPLNGTRLNIKAMAISGSSYSATLSKEYFTDQSSINKSRLIGKEGINLLPPDEEVVDHISFDQYGGIAQTTSIPELDLDILSSTTASNGERIPGNTTLSFVNFPLEQDFKKETLVSYLSDHNFDPKAYYIIIDGTSQAKLNQQTIRLVNRPSGTMDSISPLRQQNVSSYQLNTSNFVRSMLNPKTGRITYYYHDSRDNRWIQSNQQINEGNSLNISFNSSNSPGNFVFRWVEYRTQSKIF
jgi:hypothetical protein